jgi:hypothetical protein
LKVNGTERISSAGKGTFATAKLTGLSAYANNAAALAGGLVAGDAYLVAGSDPRTVAVVF